MVGWFRWVAGAAVWAANHDYGGVRAGSRTGGVPRWEGKRVGGGRWPEHEQLECHLCITLCHV